MSQWRSGLRDEQWERIEPLLPGRKGSSGRPARNNRLFVDAVLYRLRVGCPGRDLPAHFGDFRVVHTRWMRWARRGIWRTLLEHVADQADHAYAMLDATIVRAHPHSAGARKKGLLQKPAARRSAAAKAA
jgi:transposase